jgi:hypothetical protein
MVDALSKIKRVLKSARLYSAVVIGYPLRDYQLGPVDAVVDSCLHKRGLEFLWVFPRQSGKDEAIGQLCAYLLALFQRVEAGVVHVYPSSSQISTGTTRLDYRLDNIFSGGRQWSGRKPIRRGLGKAQVAFFSGNPQAKSEGATANLLLIINEVQDQHEPTIERRFTPMRASANATALFVGTVRTTSDYLWTVKSRLERLTLEDGIKRVFIVGPDDVALENPHYGEFVANQVRLKGREHPSVKTELFNEPVDTAAGLFPARRRGLMAGAHARLAGPVAGEAYVALLDVGGQDEAATSQFAELVNPGRDYTVLTIVRVTEGDDLGPRYEAVDVFTDQGSRHFEDHPGRPALFTRLVSLLDRWRPAAVVVDASGVGQGLSDALSERFQGKVWPFDFSKQQGKAWLGNAFLSLIETGRFRYFAEASAVAAELSDVWWFLLQAEYCGYELAEGYPIERGLRWSVRAGQKHVLSDGSVVDVHDDRLLSAALVGYVEQLRLDAKLFFGSGASVVVRPQRRRDSWQ